MAGVTVWRPWHNRGETFGHGGCHGLETVPQHEAVATKVLVKLDRDDVEAAWRRARPVAEASSVSA
jgi:hypothetical protein